MMQLKNQYQNTKLSQFTEITAKSFNLTCYWLNQGEVNVQY